MEINWPHVRQIILNDRPSGYKPDRASIRKLSLLLPDMKVLGFGKYYEYTGQTYWYVIVESLGLPYSLEPVGARGAIPISSIGRKLSAVINQLTPPTGA